MAKVIFKESSYDYNKLKADVHDVLEALGHVGISAGTKVLIKPNFLAPAHPDRAITTHPNIVRAVAEYALDKGAVVQVSDSEAMGSFSKVIKDCGYEESLAGLPVKLSELTESANVMTQGPFGKIELAKDALEADVIINLPKLKTHTQMALTLAVKNLFGCVVGARKPEWHFRVGEDKELFAKLLVSIYDVLRPSINLMDGILAMEGTGPGTRGVPRHLGLLIASTDALSLDTAICEMFGLDHYALMTSNAARELCLEGDDPKVTIEGAMPAIKDFDIPETTDLLFGPRFARGFLRRHIASRPVNLLDACKYCNECVGICPAKAITNPGKKLVFDYNKCIRCYCCIEVCPHAAMIKHDTIVKKMLGVFIERRRRAMGERAALGQECPKGK